MNYSWGIEVELADIDTRKGVPGECSFSDTEKDIVNSNGLACDARRKEHPWGGEIRTPPTTDKETQVERFFNKIIRMYPEGTVNFRLDLHCHIAYPGLVDNLDGMKRLLKYAKEQSGTAIKIMYDMTKDPRMTFGDWSFYSVNMAVIPDWKYEMAMNATDIAAFRLAHQCDTTGKFNSRLTKRYGVNLFSIFKHGTIEFRHFYPTLKSNEVYSCLVYIEKFVDEALSSSPRPIDIIIGEMIRDGHQFPTELIFYPIMQEGWKYTSYTDHKGNQLERHKKFLELVEQSEGDIIKLRELCK